MAANTYLENSKKYPILNNPTKYQKCMQFLRKHYVSKKVKTVNTINEPYILDKISIKSQ